jgi:hypothetical protein
MRCRWRREALRRLSRWHAGAAPSQMRGHRLYLVESVQELKYSSVDVTLYPIM